MAMMTTIPVTLTSHLGWVHCPGVEFKRPKFQALPAPTTEGKLSLEEYKFMPHFDPSHAAPPGSKPSITTIGVYHILMDLFFENLKEKTLKIQEVLTRSRQALSPLIQAAAYAKPGKQVNQEQEENDDLNQAVI